MRARRSRAVLFRAIFPRVADSAGPRRLSRHFAPPPQAEPSGLGFPWVRRRKITPKRRYLGFWGAEWYKNVAFWPPRR